MGQKSPQICYSFLNFAHFFPRSLPQHQYCTVTSGFACIWDIGIFSIKHMFYFSCTLSFVSNLYIFVGLCRESWCFFNVFPFPWWLSCQVGFVIFFVFGIAIVFQLVGLISYNFVLFHNGWLAKLKEDWRFPGTEPQGGDEKALSNNSNSHRGAFYHFHCSRFKIVTNFWYDVVKWFKFFQIIQSHCCFSNADI